MCFLFTRKLLFLFFLLASSFLYCAATSGFLELKKLEKRIELLEKEKKKEKKIASYHERRATDWQFNKDFFLESRRERLLVEKAEEKIRLIEIKVEECKKEKKSE